MSSDTIGQISQEDLEQTDTLDWSQENEFLNSYKLSDGTLLKVKYSPLPRRASPITTD